MKRTRFLFLPALAILILLVGLLGLVGEHQGQAHAVAAKKLTVANCRNDTQLQAVITKANADNAGDTITFKCSGDIHLSKTLTITGSMTLDGSGQTVTLDGNDSLRVLEVSSGVSFFTLNALTIAHGSEASNDTGGGLDNQSGTMNISNSTFASNSTSGGGGGLTNGFTMNISNSTFANNSASSGGGLANGNIGTLNISNSTFANNSAIADGGGLYKFGGTVNISNSTFANNSAGEDGGGLTNKGNTTIVGSIVANNTGGNCANFGTITSTGYNLESGTDCGFTSTGDLQSTDPKLDPNGLGSNGGPTQTIALQQDSPAIDHVPLANCPSTDQRGNVRPDDPSESACDIGAYESSF